MTRLVVIFPLAVSTALLAFTGAPGAMVGTVVDAATRRPLSNAIVTIAGTETRTDDRGMFRVAGAGDDKVLVRAYGYGRAEVTAAVLSRPPGEIALTRVRPKAVYLSVYGIGSRALREPVLELIETTELNALVIDVKGDRGLIPYPSTVALAATVGARRVTTIADLPALLTTLRDRGIYTIARIVVFKDDPLASSRDDLAVRRRDGSIYRDREGLAWTDANSAEVRGYNIAIAREVAQAGFDEIQFDYVRLPDATGLALGFADTQENRTGAINTFLTEARETLMPFNVFLAADVFGYICWNSNDTGIGQQLGQIAERVDYISPMLYPSSFQFGIPGCTNPVQNPYEIVQRSLEQAVARTKLPPVRFRPWLQAFRDYAFGGRAFTAGEVRAQITAAEDVGANGWMLWNPQNKYSRTDLLPVRPGQ